MARYLSTVRNGYYLALDVDVQSQNVSTNTSVLGWTLSLFSGSSSFNARCDAALNVSGTWWERYNTYFSIGYNSSVVLNSGSKTVVHEPDGSSTVRVDASFKTITQSGSWICPQLDILIYHVLPPIGRGVRERFPDGWGRSLVYEKTGAGWVRCVVYEKTGSGWVEVTG